MSDNEKKKVETTQITFRLPVSVLNKLDDLCKTYGVKRGDFLIECVNIEYDKLNNNSELKSMLEQFKQLTETMRGIVQNQ